MNIINATASMTGKVTVCASCALCRR